MGLLKYKTLEGWKALYSGYLRNMLRKDRNLSDLANTEQARINLGLHGSENQTHYHDDRYVKKGGIPEEMAATLTHYVLKAGDTMQGALNFAGNVWNKFGTVVGIGGLAGKGGKLTIQGLNGETGIALVEKDNPNNAAMVSYNGTTVKVDKPVNITGNTGVTGTLTVSGQANLNGSQTKIAGATTIGGALTVNGTGLSTIKGNAQVNGTLTANGLIYANKGFYAERVDVDKLGSYHQKANFIFGSHTEGKSDELGKLISTSSWDYAGIAFGAAINSSTKNMTGCIAQLICNNGNKLMFRANDGSQEGWSKWHSLMFEEDQAIVDQKLAQNGYIKFANKLLIQWGKYTANATGANTLTWNYTKNKAIYAVTTTMVKASTEDIQGGRVASITTTNCKIYNATKGTVYYWIAIGQWSS